MKIKLGVSRRLIVASILVAIAVVPMVRTTIFLNNHLRANSFLVSWRKILVGGAIRNVHYKARESQSSRLSVFLSSCPPLCPPLCPHTSLIPGPNPLQVLGFNFNDLLGLDLCICLVWCLEEVVFGAEIYILRKKVQELLRSLYLQASQ